MFQNRAKSAGIPTLNQKSDIFYIQFYASLPSILLTTAMEQLLLHPTECFVYKIPYKLTSASSGHRAELWNLEKVFVEKTTLKIITDGAHFRTLRIQVFYETSNNSDKALLAECPMNFYKDRLKKLEYYVEECTDSSRYFVLRLIPPENKKKNKSNNSTSGNNSQSHVFLGVGFRERHEATSFKECLYGYVRSMKREIQAEDMAKVRQTTSSKNDQEKGDSDSETRTREGQEDDKGAEEEAFSKLSLKEGEKIHVKINRPSSRNIDGKPKRKGGGGFALLRPPPSASANTSGNSQQLEVQKDDVTASKVVEENNEQNIAEEEISRSDTELKDDIHNDDDDDDNWGDFEEAT